MNREKIKSFIKGQLLMIAMTLGIIGYFVADGLLTEPVHRHALYSFVTGILPYLLFAMLFLEFSKINPADLFPKPWLLKVFAYQLISAMLMVCVLLYCDTPVWMHTIWFGWLTCVLSPTATAVAVMSSKLGGNGASATTYAVLSSLLTAVAVPIMFPFVSPQSADLSFVMLFGKIFAKVFPVIIVPLILSLLMRRFTPKWHQSVSGFAKDTSFYLWSVCIAINTAQIARLLFGGIVEVKYLIVYVIFSLLLCVGNFALGKYLGNNDNDRISAGQCLGQKNTILAIWITMSFLSPESGIILGAYMLWQNVLNSMQLSFPKLR